jgi:hypothetical protein
LQVRIRKIVVIGSPGVVKSDFTGNSEVLIKADPPEGHMAGPRVLLESLDAVWPSFFAPLTQAEVEARESSRPRSFVPC